VKETIKGKQVLLLRTACICFPLIHLQNRCDRFVFQKFNFALNTLKSRARPPAKIEMHVAHDDREEENTF
jgi:hypothetical protein